MPLNWMDVSETPFEAVLLLERVQLGWLPGWGLPERELGLALAANPAVEWFLRQKNPALAGWLEGVRAQTPNPAAALAEAGPQQVRQAEQVILRALEDLLVYALDPAIYDAQPFLAWDSRELSGLVDFSGKRVLDIGAGTGRLAFVAAPLAAVVYAVEPVENLRAYMRAKAARLGLRNVYALDGLVTAIPFECDFADVTMGGHVFGDDPPAECAELLRVTRPGGMLILCPGNNDCDNDIHHFLVGQGFAWSVFEEPQDGPKRKYWIHKG